MLRQRARSYVNVSIIGIMITMNQYNNNNSEASLGTGAQSVNATGGVVGLILIQRN